MIAVNSIANISKVHLVGRYCCLCFNMEDLTTSATMRVTRVKIKMN